MFAAAGLPDGQLIELLVDAATVPRFAYVGDR
jgi:hypothetical protein